MTGHDVTVYESLANSGDDRRWAFGTGFEDPLAGVDMSVPSGVDGADLAAYATMLGDDALIASQRVAEWITRLPELEVETAIANVALDLLGQARMLFARACGADGSGRGEDDLAYLRDAHDWHNVCFVEGPDADFAGLVMRLALFATWRLAVFSRLRDSTDPILAAIAAKAAKELTYHRDFAAQWVVSLGDGTEHSHQRVQAALDALWPLVEELFLSSPVERRLQAVAVDPVLAREEFEDVVGRILEAATLRCPGPPGGGQHDGGQHGGGQGGRDGRHSEHLAALLDEMQSVARAHPGATW